MATALAKGASGSSSSDRRWMVPAHAGRFLCFVRVFFVLATPAHLDLVTKNSPELLQPVFTESALRPIQS